MVSLDSQVGHQSRKNQVNSNANTFMNINVSDDLLAEILIRLPDCRSAIQCRTVCKRWNSLISDPPFARSFIHHRHRSSPHHHRYTLLCPTGHEIPVHETPGAQKPPPRPSFLPEPGAKIMASSDDLLLVSPPSPARVYYVYNPVTRRRLVLPAAPDYSGAEPSGFGLVCEPAVCDKQLGCTTNCEYRYRVVLFYWGGSKAAIVTASVFSSETLEWSEHVSPRPRGRHGEARIGNRSGRVVSCGGILYWNHRTEAEGQFIVAFDAFCGPRQWQFLALPGRTAARFHLFMGACGGRLRICRPYFSWYALGLIALDVWELRDCGDIIKGVDAAAAEGTWWRIVGQAFHVAPLLYDKLEIAVDPNYDNALLMSDSKFSVDRHEFHIFHLMKRVGTFKTDHYDQLYSAFPLLKPSWPTLLGFFAIIKSF